MVGYKHGRPISGSYTREMLFASAHTQWLALSPRRRLCKSSLVSLVHNFIANGLNSRGSQRKDWRMTIQDSRMSSDNSATARCLCFCRERNHPIFAIMVTLRRCQFPSSQSAVRKTSKLDAQDAEKTSIQLKWSR